MRERVEVAVIRGKGIGGVGLNIMRYEETGRVQEGYPRYPQ